MEMGTQDKLALNPSELWISLSAPSSRVRGDTPRLFQLPLLGALTRKSEASKQNLKWVRYKIQEALLHPGVVSNASADDTIQGCVCLISWVTAPASNAA